MKSEISVFQENLLRSFGFPIWKLASNCISGMIFSKKKKKKKTWCIINLYSIITAIIIDDDDDDDDDEELFL